MRALVAIAGLLIAAALIAVLAFTGQWPGEEKHVRFQPAGIVAKLPSRASQIKLRAGGVTFRLTRIAANRWQDAARPGAPGQEILSRQVAAGLHFLAVTAPSRVIDQAPEATGLAEFGLAPEHYRVTLLVGGQAVCAIAFGGLNPAQTAQYVRVIGRPKVYLMPLHLGRQWEAVAASAARTTQPLSVSPQVGREGKPGAGASD